MNELIKLGPKRAQLILRELKKEGLLVEYLEMIAPGQYVDNGEPMWVQLLLDLGLL